jgi:hypothetical protein
MLSGHRKDQLKADFILKSYSRNATVPLRWLRFEIMINSQQFVDRFLIGQEEISNG